MSPISTISWFLVSGIWLVIRFRVAFIIVSLGIFLLFVVAFTIACRVESEATDIFGVGLVM